jgi:hypothetical protein
VSLTVNPCLAAGAVGTWTPVAGLAWSNIVFRDIQAGRSFDTGRTALAPTTSGGGTALVDAWSPLGRPGKHILNVRMTILDADLNPIISGKASVSWPCALLTSGIGPSPAVAR